MRHIAIALQRVMATMAEQGHSAKMPTAPPANNAQQIQIATHAQALQSANKARYVATDTALYRMFASRMSALAMKTAQKSILASLIAAAKPLTGSAALKAAETKTIATMTANA